MPIFGTMLREKTLKFNERLNGDPNFKASNGWLIKFQARYGIRGLNICGEKLSAKIVPLQKPLKQTLINFQVMKNIH